MRQLTYILLITLTSTTNLIFGQVKYDTIPVEEILTGVYWEKFPIIKNVDYQLVDNFSEAISHDSIKMNGRVFISTIFGKDGKLKDTKIVKGLCPKCDSIAFYSVFNLKEWLPGIDFHGNFVDIQFTFPFNIEYDSKNKLKRSYLNIFGCTDEEYLERKKRFDSIKTN